MKKNANPNWEYCSKRDLLIANVGFNFGENPEEQLDRVREQKKWVADRVLHLTGAGPSSLVADFGSGGGFVARAVADRVKHLTCIDISHNFLELCKDETKSFQNIRYVQSAYGKFPDINDGVFDMLYSIAVFIHMNFYDYIYHLIEINRVLRTGGMVYFDILDADTIDVRTQPSIRRHLPGYAENREVSVFNVVHPFSLSALKTLIPQLGFRLASIWMPKESKWANPAVIIQKTEEIDAREIF